MTDTVKIIIEIPKSALELLNTTGVDWLDAEHILSAVANGTPLDNNSERAEAQAYFDGEAYGWEQGRKALIDDVKAEFINSYPTNDMGELVSGGTMFWFSLNKVLEILDNIGKADMRDKI